MKHCLFRGTHTPQDEKPQGTGLSVFIGLDIFIGQWVGGLFQLIWGRGGDFQELDRCPLFGLFWFLFSHWVVFNSLWPYELQHIRLPCPSPSSRACSNSCSLSWGCHLTISSSVIPFSSCPQSFPTAQSFQMSQLSLSSDQSIGASASVHPVNVPLGLTDLISLQSKGLSRVFSSTTIQKHQFWGIQPSSWSNSLIHTWWLEKPSFDYMDLCWQSDISAFEYTILVCHSFSSKEQVSFNFMSEVTIYSDFGAQENKIRYCLHFFPFYLPWSDGTRCHDLFECWVLRQLFHPCLSPSSKSSLVPLHFLPWEWCRLHIWGYWYFSWQSWFQLVFLPAQRFFMMYSVYKLNTQGDNIQPWHTPFPVWNQSVVPCPVLTVASWPAYRFLKRQVRWSGIPICLRIFQFIVIHTVKGFGIVNKAEIDVFLELLLFPWSSGCWQFDLWFLCLF